MLAFTLCDSFVKQKNCDIFEPAVFPIIVNTAAAFRLSIPFDLISAVNRAYECAYVRYYV